MNRGTCPSGDSDKETSWPGGPEICSVEIGQMHGLAACESEIATIEHMGSGTLQRWPGHTASRGRNDEKGDRQMLCDRRNPGLALR